MALTSTQITAFTTNQVGVLAGFSSPLVLDLSGNGITTQSVTAGAKFDLNATGQAINTGWVSGSGEGLLVYDPTNGPITSGSQLFGTSTVLPNGQKAANGFAALAALDTNKDGVINSSDAGWSNLKVWVGESSNGLVQGGQLESLDSLGIVQLNLSYSSSPTMNNGNIVGMVSSFVTNNGQTHEMADVWFQTAPAQSTSTIASLSSSQVAMLTTSQVTSLSTGGQVAALTSAQVSGLTATQIAALSPLQVSSVNSAAGLQSQVGALTQAMSGFSQVQSSASATSTTSILNTLTNVDASSSPLAVPVNVSSMVGALQQFNSNLTLTATPLSVTVTSTSTALPLSPISTQSSNGILTAPSWW